MRAFSGVLVVVGILALLAGVVVGAIGGYVAYTTPCETDDASANATAGPTDCVDVWSYVYYAGSGLAVVGTFVAFFGWVRYAYA